MNVSIRLFASLRDLVGERELRLELNDGASINDLKRRLIEKYPAITPAIQTAVFAVNDEYVAFDAMLQEGSDVSLIPPVSGGSGAQVELFRVTYEALDGQVLADLVRRDDAGAIAVFYGVVRNHNDGKAVSHLEYEAHESMAMGKLKEVAQMTKREFPEIAEVGAWHRIGSLKIGETSLLVAVSSAHRQEAFESCHWAVDRIKEIVPVWKKEYGPDGPFWLEGHAIDPPSSADR